MWISLRLWRRKISFALWAQVIFCHHKLSDIHTHITDLGSFVIIYGRPKLRNENATENVPKNGTENGMETDSFPGSTLTSFLGHFLGSTQCFSKKSVSFSIWCFPFNFPFRFLFRFQVQSTSFLVVPKAQKMTALKEKTQLLLPVRVQGLHVHYFLLRVNIVLRKYFR